MITTDYWIDLYQKRIKQLEKEIEELEEENREIYSKYEELKMFVERITSIH